MKFIPHIIQLDNLIIEDKVSEYFYTYEESLESLRERGYQRHLRSDEAFRILIDGLKNPRSKYKKICDNMLSSCNEWLSLAFIGSIIILDPVIFKRKGKDFSGNPYTLRKYELKECSAKIETDLYYGKNKIFDLENNSRKIIELLYGGDISTLSNFVKNEFKTKKINSSFFSALAYINLPEYYRYDYVVPAQRSVGFNIEYCDRVGSSRGVYVC